MVCGRDRIVGPPVPVESMRMDGEFRRIVPRAKATWSRPTRWRDSSGRKRPDNEAVPDSLLSRPKYNCSDTGLQTRSGRPSLGMRPPNTSSASESNLWRGRHKPTARHGHPGQPHCTSFTLAKRLCRNGWSDRPDASVWTHHCLGRGASAPDTQIYADYYIRVRTHRSLDTGGFANLCPAASLRTSA